MIRDVGPIVLIGYRFKGAVTSVDGRFWIVFRDAKHRTLLECNTVFGSAPCVAVRPVLAVSSHFVFRQPSSGDCGPRPIGPKSRQSGHPRFMDCLVLPLGGAEFGAPPSIERDARNRSGRLAEPVLEDSVQKHQHRGCGQHRSARCHAFTAAGENDGDPGHHDNHACNGKPQMDLGKP